MMAAQTSQFVGAASGLARKSDGAGGKSHMASGLSSGEQAGAASIAQTIDGVYLRGPADCVMSRHHDEPRCHLAD